MAPMPAPLIEHCFAVKFRRVSKNLGVVNLLDGLKVSFQSVRVAPQILELRPKPADKTVKHVKAQHPAEPDVVGDLELEHLSFGGFGVTFITFDQALKAA